MIGRLPSDLEVGGKLYKIRTDFRDILTIMLAFADPELDEREKYAVMLTILYEDHDIPAEDVPEAAQAAGLSAEQVQLITEENGAYKLKFKAVELWERLGSLWDQ